jgi:predicted O-methyltransferase YrrM
MAFKRDEINSLLGTAVGFPAVLALGWWLCGPIVTIPALTVMFIALLAVSLHGTRRLRGDIEDTLHRVQGLLFLQSHLQTEQPLPPLGGPALTPDSAATLLGVINQQRPGLIVELGSGVSTLICAHALRQLGSGKVISLDHDSQYAAVTRANLRRHGLQDWAEVRVAPIEPTTIDNKTWQWYATAQLEQAGPIDLLIVDGPPKGVQEHARYPAARVLFDRLAPTCTILLDDTNRRDEREIVRLWQRELNGFEVSELPAGKGATLFRRAA